VTVKTAVRRKRTSARGAADSVGFASIVGAGPGAPDLLTIRALDRLHTADLVLYDGLVPKAIVDLAQGAQCVSVARRVGPKVLTQDEVTDRIIAGARAGLRVVRLKAGDPFVFGRGGEEARALVAAKIPFEIVPGLSSALAAPALAGIPTTHRGLSAAVVVVSGHDPASYEPVLRGIEPGSATVVVLMGLGSRRQVARSLVRAGWPRSTPVAVIVEASQPSQRVWTGRLSALGLKDDVTRRDAPGVIVVGSVVSAASAFDAALPLMVEELRIWQPRMIRRH
jgi:uroporphyrin-III C-methyltransferase / precorrin-2 dehydrogenase / sirohydrochlorin ferrochelatase